MKKILTFLFFICLLIPFLSTITYIHFEKKFLKREIKQQIILGIEKNELVFLKLSISESKKYLSWEHEKEFEYKGEMYDIVESRNEGDSICYWLWWDHEETYLNKKLKKALAGIWERHDESKEQCDLLINFSKNLFFEKFVQAPLIKYYFIKEQAVKYFLPYYSTVKDIPYPPPK